MRKIQYFKCDIKNGKLKLEDDDLLKLWIQVLGDGPGSLSLSRDTQSRSSKANRYQWGWVYDFIAKALMDKLGMTYPEVVGMIKAQFDKVWVKRGGKMIEVIRSSAEMDDKEFSQRLEQVKHWVREEFDIIVPLTLKEKIEQGINQ